MTATTRYCDWGRGTVDITQLHDNGIVGICRYLSNSPGKNLRVSERDAALALGMDIVLIWESAAARALTGAAAGHLDGLTAAQQAAVIGYPKGATIFAAVDTDTTWRAVEPYLRAFGAAVGAAGYLGDLYGGYYVCHGAVAAGWSTGPWQTSAWSVDFSLPASRRVLLVEPAAVLLQDVYDFLGYLDTSEVRGQVNGWQANSKPKPGPPPGPVPTPDKPATGQETIVQIIRAPGRVAACLDSAGIGHPIGSDKWQALVRLGSRGLTVEVATTVAAEWDACVPTTSAAAKVTQTMFGEKPQPEDLLYDHSSVDGIVVPDGKVGA